MWLIELGHTICLFHLVYYYTVYQFGIPDAIIISAPGSFAASIFFHGAVAVLAQGYFTYRIARFTGPPYVIPTICSLLMACQLSFDMVVGVKAAVIAEKSVKQYLLETKWLILTPLLLRAVVDVIISVTLVYHLYYHRSASAYKNTTAVIDKLILWSIETGIITSMLSVAVIICYLINVENFAWVALYVVFPKVFSNTMLANMNSRIELRKMQSALAMSVGGLAISNSRPRSLRFYHTADKTHSGLGPEDTDLDLDKIGLGSEHEIPPSGNDV